MIKDTLKVAATVSLVVVVLSLVVGVVLGQPILLSFVETDSMEPTIGAGDGFVVVPPEFGTDPTVGDIVIFEAEQIEGGGLTTHRIVDETDQGYITRGDANPFTDQDGGEPPVTDARIVGVAVQAGGSPIVIPYLGTAIQAVQDVTETVLSPVTGALGLDQREGTTGIWLFGIGLVLLVWGLLAEWRDPRRTRANERRRTTASTDVLDTRVLAVLLIVIVLVPANAAMVFASGTSEVTIPGQDVADAEEVAPGDPVEFDITVRNDGLMTVLTILEPTEESGNVTIAPGDIAVPSGETGVATATAPAPPPDVDATITVGERRYLLLVPESVLLTLHDRSPLLALGVLNGLIVVAVAGIVWGLFGFKRVRERNTERDVPLLVRLRQRFL